MVGNSSAPSSSPHVKNKKCGNGVPTNTELSAAENAAKRNLQINIRQLRKDVNQFKKDAARQTPKTSRKQGVERQHLVWDEGLGMEGIASNVVARFSQIASDAPAGGGMLAVTFEAGPLGVRLQTTVSADEKTQQHHVHIVNPGGQADANGVMVGDTIVSIGGIETAQKTHEQLLDMLRDLERPLTVVVQRNSLVKRDSASATI
jgi:C-terminal processing protease CtpA/Prc